MLKLQKYKSSTCQSPRDQVVAHHQMSSTSQQQRLNMQVQNLRGSSPPNQNVSQLLGEISIQASVAPIKLSEKLPSPNLEQVSNVSIDFQKDPSPNNKHVASKNASGFAPLSVSASKKYEVVESTQTPVGQWSPENQKVKRQYTREFLIQLLNMRFVTGHRYKRKKFGWNVLINDNEDNLSKSCFKKRGGKGEKDRIANDMQQPKGNNFLSKLVQRKHPPKTNRKFFKLGKRAATIT
ncbi:hypothetical protein Anas_13985 [Armadillidium nasatum]|uniref:Uncharacterized protein n=1 Tax=Armadillidium nasatum TaxID=96803 RepID=A0A5N5T0I1_9CRUS|nr:hypothetical protein Anas_13985 [Armadillidium nasatum]